MAKSGAPKPKAPKPKTSSIPGYEPLLTTGGSSRGHTPHEASHASGSAGYHYEAAIPGYKSKTPTGTPSPGEAAKGPAGDYAGAGKAYEAAVEALPTPARTITEEAHAEAQAEHQAERRAARAAARQEKVIDKYVTQAYSEPTHFLGSSEEEQAGSTSSLGLGRGQNTVFGRVSAAQEKSKSTLAAERDRLLSHPSIQKANAEGKVVGLRGLSKIAAREQQAQTENHAFDVSHGLKRTKEFGVSPRGLVQTPAQIRHLEEIQGVPQGRVGRLEAEAKAKEQEEGAFGVEDIAGLAKGAAEGVAHLAEDRWKHLSSPLGQVEDSADLGHALASGAAGLTKNIREAAAERWQKELHRGSGEGYAPPSVKEIIAAGEIAAVPTAAGDVAAGIETLAKLGASGATKMAAEGGAKQLAKDAGEAIGSKAAGAGRAAKAAVHLPGQAAEGVRAIPDLLRGTPAAAGRGLKQLPEALRVGGKGTSRSIGRVAGQTATGSAHNFALASGAGALHRANIDVPGEPLGRIGTLAEGTAKAFAHNPWGTLETTGRSIPGLVAGPAALLEAGGESIVKGSPKPFLNTAGALGGGSWELGTKLLSGNEPEVQRAAETEVGGTPFVALPSFLQKLHSSHIYEAPRGALRKSVERRRDVKRAKHAESETGQRYHARKKPKQPVPVSNRSDEHYVFSGLGSWLEGHKARQAVALDTTRASDRAEAEGKLVGHHVVQGFRSKAGTLSILSHKMGPEYEALAWPMAKYGLPHTKEGYALAKELAEYFPAPDTPVPGSLTDRMAVNAGLEHPGVFTEGRHAEGTEAIREMQRELTKLRGRSDVAPHRIQNDFTNYLSRKKGLAPVLKDYERITKRANEFTSPAEASASLRAQAGDLRSKAESLSLVTPKGKTAKIISADTPYELVKQWRDLNSTDYVWVYHRTTPEVAAKAERDGLIEGAEPHQGVRARKNFAPSKGTYVTLNRKLAEKYARESNGTVLALRVQKKDVTDLPEERGLPGGRTTGLSKYDQAIVRNVPAENVTVLDQGASLSKASKQSAAKREAESLRGQADKIEQQAEIIAKGGVVSRQGAWAHYEYLNAEYDRIRRDAEKETERAKVLRAEVKQRETAERKRQMQGGGKRIAGEEKRSDLPASKGAVRPAIKGRGANAGQPRLKASSALEAKRAELLDIEANVQGLRAQAKAILKQKKPLYGELKGFTKHDANFDTSQLKHSSTGMKEEFRREQIARAKMLGLHEPVYVADIKPQLLGERGVSIERPIPVRAQHFKEGSLARSGESSARFESVLQHSALSPRTRMAINELVHSTVNERKLPVKVRGTYKHVMTEADAEWAKRHGTWPANAVALDSGLVKQGLVGPHQIDGEAINHVLAAAEHGGEEGQALQSLAQKYPDIKDELLAAAKEKGRKIIAVEKAAIQELKDQFAPLSDSARRFRTAMNVPSRILLNDPAWVFAQMFATGIPIAMTLGPGAVALAPAAVKTMIDIQKRPIADQARIASIVGSSTGLRGTPKSAFEAASDPFSQVRAIRRTPLGRKAWKLANGETMGKFDRWNAAKMREFAAAVRASKGFRNWYGGFRGLNRDMERVAKATKGMKAADRLDYLSRHPELARSVQKHLNTIGGNWNSFTALERKVSPFLVFYPWIRYSLMWTFHTFPINHPVAATALSLLAQRNANELQKIAAEEAKKAGVTGIAQHTPLADIFAYGNPVHRNANNKPVENPRGIRFAPGVGVGGEVLLTGQGVKALGALNPILNAGVSLATQKDLFTGQPLQGPLWAQLAEQGESLIPGFRAGAQATNFKIQPGQPQSATSKAYEMLAGGRGARISRSVLWPYLDRSASKGGLENALTVLDERISSTGHDAQSKVEFNLRNPSAKNRREAEKLKAENKKAWEEKESLLKAIDPSGKLSKQSNEEYEHYKASLPPIGGSSGGGGIYNKSSIYGKKEGEGGSSSIYDESSIYGGKKKAENKVFHPEEDEGFHLPGVPNIHVPGLGVVTGTLGSLLGGTAAQAASLPQGRKQAKKTFNQAEAKKVLEAQGANPNVAGKIASNPQARKSLFAATSAGYGTTRPLTKGEHREVANAASKRGLLGQVHQKTLGTPTARELVAAGKAGKLRLNSEGLITTPKVRRVQKQYEAAKTLFDEKAVPKLSPLSSGGESTQFAEWFAHYSHLHPEVAAAWVLSEGAGEGGTTGGEAGRNNWLAAGYPAHRTAFSEAPYFNGGAKRAAKATAEWMEGKIGSEFGYPVSNGIRNAFSQFKGRSPEEQAQLIASSGWVDGKEALNSGYLRSIMSNMAAVGVLGRGGRVPKEVRQRLTNAKQQAKALGLPIEQEGAGTGFQVPYRAFGRHVQRDLHRVIKSPGYNDNSSTKPITVRGAHGGTLVREVQGSSGVASVINKNKDPEIAARLLLLSAKTGKTIYVLSGYRTPEQAVAVGGFADDPHTKGEAMDIGVDGKTISSANSISEKEYESVGLYRPYGTAHGGSSSEDNHVQLLNNGSPSTAGYVAGSSASATAGSSYVSPSGAPTASAVSAYAQATGKPAPKVRGELKSKKLSPQTLYQTLQQIGRIYSGSAVGGVIPGFEAPKGGIEGGLPTLMAGMPSGTLAKERKRLLAVTGGG